MAAGARWRESLRRAGATALVAGFVALWCAFCAVPFVLERTAGLGWAVVAGIALPVLWLSTMPCSCSTGGLGASILGMQQFALLCLWTLRGLVLAATWLFAG